MTKAVVPQTQSPGIDLEKVLIKGDLAELTPPQRVQYYTQVCESVGLNPLTKPFDYIVFNGKLTLYAKKDAAEQLRKLHDVSITDLQITGDGNTFEALARAALPNGRTDADMGVVPIKGLSGDKLANAKLKAVTKAKRRVTLSICGLGFLDETEIETIHDARPIVVTPEGAIVATNPTPTNGDHPGKVIGKKVEPVNPVAPNGDRPYKPEVLKAKLSQWAKAYKAPCTDSHRKMLAGTLNTIFEGDDESRYDLCDYLTGQTSTKDVPDAYIQAMLKTWLEIDGWDQPPSGIAIQEAHALLDFIRTPEAE